MAYGPLLGRQPGSQRLSDGARRVVGLIGALGVAVGVFLIWRMR